MAILDGDLFAFGNTPIGRRELSLTPTDSWWATAPREGFSVAFHGQERRESRKTDTARPREAHSEPKVAQKRGRKPVAKVRRCSSSACRRWLSEVDAKRGCVRCVYCRMAA
jgi:hypothetical protein